MIARLPWQPGGAAGWEGPVLVSLTDFEVFRRRDQPRIFREGMGLRRSWPQMPGAVGLWLWGVPLKRRSGSVSVWRSEEDLRAFVRWAPHVAIMRRNRDGGRLVATTWEHDHFHPSTIWAEARRRL